MALEDPMRIMGELLATQDGAEVARDAFVHMMRCVLPIDRHAADGPADSRPRPWPGWHGRREA